MQYTETIALLTRINQADPLVILDDATVDIWVHTMEHVEFDDAWQAVLDHYRLHDNVPAKAAAIRKRAMDFRASKEGRAKALTAGPRPVANPLSYRQRNPEEWDRLYEEGRRQGNAEREAATRRRAMAA